MDYSKIALRFANYIKSRGKTVYIIRKTETGGEPWNPTTSDSTPIEIKAIQANYKKSEIDGALILKNDKKYIVTSENEIKISDKIRDGVHDLSVVDVTPVAPGGITILSILQVRK